MYVLGSKNKYDSLTLRFAYRVNGNLREVSHTFTASTPPVPEPVPTPTPSPSISKKVRSIEEVDFANFTFPPVEDCGQRSVSLKMGRFEDKEIRVQLRRKVLYVDLTGEKINQAIVTLDCDTYGNFFITEIFLYTLRNGEPVLLAKLPESTVDRDYKKYYSEGYSFGISRVEANKGKLAIYKLADGSHACPENEARLEYAWNGKSFVLSGKPVKTRLKNCGAEEKPPFQFQELPVAFGSIDYINWYGNTEFAYQKRNIYYKALQGLHSGIDFIAPNGTPIKSVVDRTGKVVSINNEPHDYKAGPGNVLIDYGDFLILCGHTQKSNLPKKIKPGAVIDPNDTIAYIGSDEWGLIHLHLEVIRKNAPGSSRPGDVRTNPVPFFSSTALAQLKQKAKGIGATFHPIPGKTQWQTPEYQPDIIPGGTFLVP